MRITRSVALRAARRKLGLEAPSRKGLTASPLSAEERLGRRAAALARAILGGATSFPTTTTLAPRPVEEAISASTTARRRMAKRVRPSSMPAKVTEVILVLCNGEAIKGPVCSALGPPLLRGGLPLTPY